jgi:uncharacterized membrane protein (TIGR02234 family)
VAGAEVTGAEAGADLSQVRSARRTKYLILLVIVLASGLGLLASTQTWYTVHLTSAANHPSSIAVLGSAAAPALTALSLAGLAVTGALAIAGRIARVIVAVLGLLLAGCIVLSCVLAMANPDASAISAVTKATGIAGDASVTHLIARTDATIWPVSGLIAGIVIVLASVAVLMTTRRWPDGSKRYQAVKFADATAADTAENPRDAAIDNWDELSRGDDPTR